MKGLSKYGNSVMTLVMLAIFLVLVTIALRYPPEARLMPLVVGIPPILLCLLQLVLDARERRQGATHERSELEKAQEQVSRIAGHRVEFETLPGETAELSPQETVRREVVLWGYFLGFIAGILLFGFWIAIPVFLVTFLRFQAKASWLMTLSLGLGVSLALYLVFEHGLKVQVHNGFIVNYLLDHVT